MDVARITNWLRQGHRAIALGVVALIFAIAGVCVAIAATSAVQYDEYAPVKVVQKLDKKVNKETYLTLDFEEVDSNGDSLEPKRSYRETFKFEKDSDEVTKTVMLHVYRNYKITLVEGSAYSNWRYTQDEVMYSNATTTGGNDTWIATDAGEESKKTLPATLKIGTVDKPVSNDNRKIALSAKLTNDQWMQDSVSVDNTLDFENFYRVTFNMNGHGNQASSVNLHKDSALSSVVTEGTLEYEAGTVDGVTLEGWYFDEECSHKVDFNEEGAITADVTLYANWKPTENDAKGLDSYWIAPASKSVAEGTNEVAVSNAIADGGNYVDETTHILKSSAEIKADVQKIAGGDEETIRFYETLMKEDKYHLYTAYKGADATSEADKFLEARIIQVGSHQLSSDETDLDNSVLTFQATHTLPTAYQTNTARTNAGGWKDSKLRETITEMTTSQDYFNSSFLDALSYTKKTSGIGGNPPTDTTEVTYDKMWIASLGELTDKGIYREGSDYNYAPTYGIEGTQYAWYADRTINDAFSVNPCMALTTRAGNNPAGDRVAANSWRLRSAGREDGGGAWSFLLITVGGQFGDDYLAEEYHGFSPCFTFSKPSVIFDNQGHGNEIESQDVDFGEKLAQPTNEEAGSAAGLVLEGWYTNSRCSADAKWDFNNDVLTGVTVLYANWVPASGEGGDENTYWISPSYKMTTGNTDETVNQNNKHYVKEQWNVKKSSAEIKEDAKVLSDTDHKLYTEDKFNEVKATYEAFMANDNYHLYTKIGTGTSKNDYAEFRLIDVGDHESGEALSFQATHSLPLGYQFNNTGVNSNSGGWKESTLNTRMTSGDIFALFKTGFTNDVSSVKKVSTKGNGDASTSDSLSKLWLTSAVEVYGEDLTVDGYKAEGSQYAFFSNRGVTTDNHTALKNLNETRAGGVPTNLSSSEVWWWLRSPSLDEATTTCFKAIKSTGEFNGTGQSNASLSVVPAFAFGGYKVTFDLAGHTATDATTPQTQLVAGGAKITPPATPVDINGELTFGGWYKDTSFADDKKWDFDKDVVGGHTTLYAYWKPNTEGYWLAPASKKTTGNDAATSNVANAWNADTNPEGYNGEEKNIKKSRIEIRDDMRVLNDVDHLYYDAEKYAKVYEEYSNYLQNDNYHLYTKWKGSTNDKTGASALNAYVEFRIIQVGEHDADGSVLTFQAIHTLPQGYRMKATNNDAVKWGSTELYTNMQSGGGIYNNFYTNFTDDIMTVKKKSTTSNNDLTITTSDNKLWILSRVETSGTTAAGYANEGVKYDYYNLSAFGENAAAPFLVRNTRAGRVNQNAPFNYSYYWTRSPYRPRESDAYGYYGINSNGGNEKAHSYNPTSNYGVVPAFSFGVGYTVKFDGNGETGGTMADQTGRLLNDGKKLTANAFTKSGYGFKCWNTEPDGSGISFKDKEVANIAARGYKEVTLYAQWIELGDYWIAPSYKLTTSNTQAVVNDAYTNPETGVVKNRAQIQEDVKVLNDVDHTKYTEDEYNSVYNEYQEFMQSDSYHLYSKWDGATALNREANNYVEFRIVNIGEHKSGTEDDRKNDGSVLTFMMTHSLTTSYPYNETQTNADGWPASQLYTRLNSSDGYFYTRFASGLRDDAMSVTKYSTKGGGTTDAPVTELTSAQTKFWVPSATELTGFTEAGYCGEGDQYQYFRDVVGLSNDGAPDTALINIHYDRAGTGLPTFEGHNRGGNYIVLRSPNTTGSQGCAWEQTANGTREYHHPGTAYWNSVTPCFALGVDYTVKFDSNGGQGEMEDQSRRLNDGKKLTANGFTKDGYGFTTWNTKADGTGKSFTDKEAANIAFEGNSEVTLYAQWKELKDYWIAPSYKCTTAAITTEVNDAYTNPETGVIKNSDEIQADMKVLSDTTHGTYTAEKFAEVEAEYLEYFNTDKYHLYTKIADDRDVDSYVEFRIVQVGEHDEDGSAVTFIATHALPTAYRINATNDNTTSWGGSELYSRMNGGDIYAMFPSTLTSDVFTVSKKTNAGNRSDNIVRANSKLWVASGVEIFGAFAGDAWLEGPYANEGVKYDFYTNVGVSQNANTKKINDAKRSAEENVYMGLNLRSPWKKSATNFLYTNGGGGVGYSTDSVWGAARARGIQPGFAFGYNTVKFVTNGGSKVDDQLLKYGGTITEPTSNKSGYELEGWYTDEALENRFDVSTEVKSDMTLYAKWKDGAGVYWLNLANAENPEKDVIKTQKEIEADVAVLLEGDINEDYEKVSKEYTRYMNGYSDTLSSEVHLYTKLNDGVNITGDAKNDYAEFRIVSVGEHDADGASLTFQMTHVLPMSQDMNSVDTNAGGYAASDLHIKLSEDGDIYSMFNDEFLEDILAVSKTSGTGNMGEGKANTADKLWIASAEEVYGDSVTESGDVYSEDATQFPYYEHRGVTKGDATNESLAFRTRAGGIPLGQSTNYDPYHIDTGEDAGEGSGEAEATERYVSWWLRTPSAYNAQTFTRIYNDGRLDHNYATSRRGVAVSFSFGKPVVKFNSLEHGVKKAFSKVITDGNVEVPTEADYGTSTGLTMENWYANEACLTDVADLTSGNLQGGEVFYANWIPTENSEEGNLSYWIAPSYKYIASGQNVELAGNSASETATSRDKYVDEEWNVLKSSEEIRQDIVKIKADDEATIKEYKQIMNNDKFHLYTKIANSVGVNDYMECRIVEVGDHDNGGGEMDGSGVTFQAIHALPSAYAYNTTLTTAGGWDKSNLRTIMNAGPVYAMFNDSFKNDVFAVEKLTSVGEMKSDIASSVDEFWLMSSLEQTGHIMYGAAGEGTEYAFWKARNIGTGSNPALIGLTKNRSGGGVGSDCGLLRSPSSKTNTKVARIYRSNGNANYYDNFANSAQAIAPCFALSGSNVKVIFDANAPEGTTATVDGSNEQFIKKAESGFTLTSSIIPADSKPEVTSSDGTTWLFAGWSENKDAKVTDGLSNSALASKNVVVEEDKTYYAIWTKKSDFWLGTGLAMSFMYGYTEGYDNEEEYALKDKNYVSGEEILSDMDVLADSADPQYATVKAKWDGYFNNSDDWANVNVKGNCVRLMTTYSGGENEPSMGGATSSMNKIVEFRILEVSGADGHAGDNSVVTFMATTMLPTAYSWSTGDSIVGGWPQSTLRESMNSGEIFNKFPKSLTDNIASIQKTSNACGATQSNETVTSYDKFWIPSYAELRATGEQSSNIPTGDGSMYALAIKNEIDCTSATDVLMVSTRADASPGDGGADCDRVWWTRTPYYGQFGADISCVWSVGMLEGFEETYLQKLGVVPCFAFGPTSEYHLSKDSLQEVLHGFRRTAPTTLNFCKGNEVPAGLTCVEDATDGVQDNNKDTLAKSAFSCLQILWPSMLHQWKTMGRS